ncbi:antiviral reverse transcriptase Drt3b [Aeromonas dhakensis]|uniref:antiviral reverse transcriptase Drt3b n=1 Tax=Aeromonas dhakensis TaxID=196024 RepID=UPI003BA33395
MKKVRLINKKERALLSDMLPYETPLIFSNKNFYDIVSKLLISFSYKQKELSWKSDSLTTDLIICMLFNLNVDNISNQATIDGRKKSIIKDNLSTIPFNYKINHKNEEFRELSIIHPRNQIISSLFYDRYKNLIIHFCNKSSFSLRHPSHVAKCIFWSDEQRITDFNEDSIEMEEREQDNLKSYFVYKDHSNIFKFFESENYHRCEKIYNRMARLDVSKCFDSIYTHSLAWATYGKNITKNILSGITQGDLRNSFGDIFDTLMQDANYKETNGIPIGPEISRIFAEIILQDIDCKVKNELTSILLTYRKDYEIFRYVDDYFIFYNHQEHYSEIKKTLQINLKKYKLNLNTSKEIIYDKPIITEITIAKNKISELLEQEINYIKTEIPQTDGAPKETKGQISVNYTNLIVEFKSILKTCNVSYSDVLNFTFSILERRLKTAIKKHLKIIPRDITSTAMMADAMKSIIEFSFFIYAVSPKVNTTIKLSRILCILINFLKTKIFSVDLKDEIYRSIYKNIIFILDKNTVDGVTQIETLHLITILEQLGRNYRLQENNLAKYIGFNEMPNGTYIERHELNYFTISTAISYIKNKERYNDLRLALEEILLEKLEQNQSIITKNTESTLIFFDFILCPFISKNTKEKIFSFFSITDGLHKELILSVSKNWFINWDDFDLTVALDRKRSFDVY